MPYKPEYAKLFLERFNSIEDQETKERIIKKMRKILDLDNPYAEGGSYLKKWWSYPFGGSCILVCELHPEKERIIFRDIILNL